MKITIVYDNEVYQVGRGLRADWGFSCFVEVEGKRILFDTGARGSILLNNMKKLGIKPDLVEEIFISHYHLDHTGGLAELLRVNPSAKVYKPRSCREPYPAEEVICVKEPLKIHENIFSTGEIRNIEQSLVVKAKEGLVVIAGCSHPGVRAILKTAAQFGKPHMLLGGLHGFSDFNLIKDLDFICPTHCTMFKEKIKLLYPRKFIRGGVGQVIEVQ